MVFLPVGFVVFLIVANEIRKSESVVRGDKIDAGVWPFTIVLIKIGTTGQSIRYFADLSLVALPKTADGIAIFPVPFRPQDWKIPHLIPAFADIPRFRDKFYLRKHRVLVNDLEESLQLVHAIGIARQGAGEIETETVHVNLEHPIAQAVHHQLKGPWVPKSEGVTSTGEV